MRIASHPHGVQYARPCLGALPGASCADCGRVIVRHSPCTPWRLPTGSGHRSALPQDPLLSEGAAPRSPPNLPHSREERFAPLPEPISARPPVGAGRGALRHTNFPPDMLKIAPRLNAPLYGTIDRIKPDVRDAAKAPGACFAGHQNADRHSAPVYLPSTREVREK